ncbi:aminotransferase class IV [Flavobacteriaceae bacterium]|jgi:branched-chain amino acid aminotransferase|nr:aminotransferase class IV [Flavobacteriaceae bacterium]MDB0068825.1 aminotransferase class IV [Flavobacteriaceae bacterium]MDB4092879.1 aminotransferase class IV [Flavobacteriaceae bacterium]MDB4164295.1 aminotransferase class IV [Flavobacteriaceae bacterium]MDC1457083.1 aminotransferase class IV [Flavobacteriaceae bacterium]|tara:strand:+ start:15818 stop:16654 length:837 start_codon:yes stop_codon:yes gene_type:complete
MINYNENYINKSDSDLLNRGFLYGDSVFESIRIVNNKIIFWEDHYMRLMSSMRIIRIEIPQSYTPDFFKLQITNTISKVNSSFTGRVRLTIFREGGGYYTPELSSPSFIVNCSVIDSKEFFLKDSDFKVDLFKDYYIQNDLLSNLKTNNKLINVLAGIYANENNLDNCILLNNKKNVTEFLNGNLFIVRGNKIITPNLDSGCLKGIMRKKIIEYVKLLPEFSIEETVISPFDLLSANEIWLTNSISGIINVTNYRNKSFSNDIAKIFIDFLNKKVSNI